MHHNLGLEKTLPSLLRGNAQVINESKTVKATPCVQCSGVLVDPRYILVHMHANAVGKVYSEAQRAYLAGFFEGDGAIMATIERHDEMKFGFRVRVTLKITQRDEKAVTWLKTVYGVGYVRKNRTTHEWMVRSKEDVATILACIQPYIHIKQPQVLLAQDILCVVIHTHDDLVAVAQKADTLSRLNVRSNNRRKNFVTMIKEYTSCND
jgi:hypothetical protein